MNERTSFDRIEYETARSQYDSWAAKKCETLDEYILRKRKIELNALVKRVLDNELSNKDKAIVRLHWYKGKTAKETADILGIDKSTVSKHLDKINSIVYDKLKYAIEYRYGRQYAQESAIIIKGRNAFAFIAEPRSTGQRIKKLRLAQAMTLEDVSEMTGIGKKKLESLESSEKDATASDLAAIAAAFKTSTDYLIFGKDERKCRQWI